MPVVHVSQEVLVCVQSRCVQWTSCVSGGHWSIQCCGLAQEHRCTRHGLWQVSVAAFWFCRKSHRENGHKQISSSSRGCLSSPNATIQSPKHEWKIVASEKTSSKCITLVRLPLVYFFLRRSFKLEPYQVDWGKNSEATKFGKSNRSSLSGVWSPMQDHHSSKSNKNCIFKNTELLCLQNNTYLCLAVLDGIFCHFSCLKTRPKQPQALQQVLQNLLKSLSFEMHPDELIEETHVSYAVCTIWSGDSRDEWQTHSCR